MKRSSFLNALALLLALFILSLGLYLSTLAPGMLRGDSGEFQWAMASLNVAHATGYPLFTLLGYAWMQLPLGGTVAWRLNLLAPIFGACAVTMVFIVARAVTRRSLAALAGALFFALSPVFWFNASILEVYTLNAFFLALMLYLLWHWAQPSPAVEPAGEGAGPKSDAALYLAFFVLGLALAHHRLTILALPGIFVFLLLTDHRFLFRWRRLVALALLVVPGLLLYVYVPLRLLAAGATWHYAFYDIILGQEFSGSLLHEFNFAPVLWEIPVQNFSVGLILAVPGLLALFRRARNWSLLLLLVLIVDVLFALIYNVPDLEVFLTPSFVILALWIAAGAAWVSEWLATHLPASLGPRAGLAAGLVMAAVALVGLGQYSNVQAQVQAEAGTAEPRARAILGSNLPRGALLELDWETATAIRFLQTTEGTRRDLEARLIKMNAREEYTWVLQNVDTGRAVYVERGLIWVRARPGYRVERASNELVQILRQGISAKALSKKINERVALTALSSDAGAVVLYWQVQRPLERDLATFIHYFDADGKPLGQEDHAACCVAIYGYRTSEWEAGYETADTFHPAPSGTTFMQIGMYAVNGGDLEPYGDTLYIQTQAVPVGLDARPDGVELGMGITARAHELVRDGSDYKLTLYWESRAPVKKDYTVFVHLLDASGKILQQADREPLDGVYPTHAWEPGQRVRETYAVPAARGGVTLEIGMYDAANGERLVRADGKGNVINIPVP